MHAGVFCPGRAGSLISHVNSHFPGNDDKQFSYRTSCIHSGSRAQQTVVECLSYTAFKLLTQTNAKFIVMRIDYQSPWSCRRKSKTRRIFTSSFKEVKHHFETNIRVDERERAFLKRAKLPTRDIYSFLHALPVSAWMHC